MSKINVWSPIQELESFKKKFTDLDDGGWLEPSAQAEDADCVPSIQMSEDTQEYTITATLPQMPKDKIKVDVESGVLILSGERKSDKFLENEELRQKEFHYNAFSRSFGIPGDADAQKIRADYRNGVLSVHLPKIAGAKSKLIHIPVRS
ncbi:MAG TPA: Hsp20/alpha crystallin family protein [Bdellovibrionota bacterium]|nr:Hsp20/alpha crystallin family protein [Bdellovibrionota bacterium]